MYGDQDDFTSASAYDSWADALRTINEESGQQDARLEIIKVGGASHFWREDHAADRLFEVVKSWAHR